MEEPLEVRLARRIAQIDERAARIREGRDPEGIAAHLPQHRRDWIAWEIEGTRDLLARGLALIQDAEKWKEEAP